MAIFKGFFRRDDGAQIPLFEEPMNQIDMHLTPRSMLTHNQMIKLVIWLKENIEAVHGLPYRKIAEIASAGVGFPVTISNLYGAEKAGEMELPIASRVNPPSTKTPTRDERIADLDARVKVLEELLLNHVAGHPTGIHSRFDGMIAA
jgi:hypothetical protein